MQMLFQRQSLILIALLMSIKVVYCFDSSSKTTCWYAWERSSFENFFPPASEENRLCGHGRGHWSMSKACFVVILYSPSILNFPSFLGTHCPLTVRYSFQNTSIFQFIYLFSNCILYGKGGFTTFWYSIRANMKCGFSET